MISELYNRAGQFIIKNSYRNQGESRGKEGSPKFPLNYKYLSSCYENKIPISSVASGLIGREKPAQNRSAWFTCLWYVQMSLALPFCFCHLRQTITDGLELRGEYRSKLKYICK